MPISLSVATNYGPTATYWVTTHTSDPALEMVTIYLTGYEGETQYKNGDEEVLQWELYPDARAINMPGGVPTLGDMEDWIITINGEGTMGIAGEINWTLGEIVD